MRVDLSVRVQVQSSQRRSPSQVDRRGGLLPAHSRPPCTRSRAHLPCALLRTPVPARPRARAPAYPSALRSATHPRARAPMYQCARAPAVHCPPALHPAARQCAPPLLHHHWHALTLAHLIERLSNNLVAMSSSCSAFPEVRDLPVATPALTKRPTNGGLTTDDTNNGEYLPISEHWRPHSGTRIRCLKSCTSLNWGFATTLLTQTKGSARFAGQHSEMGQKLPKRPCSAA